MKTFPLNSSRRGVALVITLIMLSVVTITAIAFLSVARRERSAVQAAGEQADARIAADAALSRARAQIIAQMASYTSRFAPSMLVSTNFVAPSYRAGLTVAGTDQPWDNGVQSNQWYSALTNVSYLLRVSDTQARPFNLNNAGDVLEYRRMLANLYYDPRVPVVARAGRLDNRPDSYEDRFYLDLNRNGRFDTNGFIVNRDVNNVAIGTNVFWHVGDPEWIGVLADPDRPHSGNNRFLYRIAYLVVPADRTVDLNFAHNQARQPNEFVNSRYYRNQGVGSWELNLAGLFRDLNTNLWNFYNYSTNFPANNSGNSFVHALNIWGSRGVGRFPGRDTPQRYFQAETLPVGDNAAAGRVFPDNGVDDFSNGPLLVSLDQTRYPNLVVDQAGQQWSDVVGSTWSGADATNFFSTPFQLQSNPRILSFGTGVVLTNLDTRRPNFAGQLMNVAQAGNVTYNAYTFYRLLASLGTDSSDGRIESGVDKAGRYFRRSKLNLNYQTLDPDVAQSYAAGLVITNDFNGNIVVPRAFIPWTATNWMQIAADRLLRKEFTNGLPELDNFLYSDPYPPYRRLVPPFAKEPAAHGVVIGGRYVVTNFVRGQQIVSETNYIYSAQAHRLLQLAANLHEVRTNIIGGLNTEPFPPHVYRPTFYRHDVPDPRRAGNTLPAIRLAGFEEITNANFIINTPWTNWVDFDDPQDVLRLSTNPSQPTRTNVFGIPFVVGAKQNQSGRSAIGLPKFNEAFWQTRVRVGRRLLLEKPDRGTVYATNLTTLKQLGSVTKRGQYIIEIHNTAAAEALNAYVTNFPPNRPLRLIATNWTDITLYNGEGRYISATQPYGRPLVIPQGNNPNLPISAFNSLTMTRTRLSTQIGNVARVGTGVAGYKAVWDGGEFIPTLNSNMVFSLIYNPVNTIETSVFPIGQTNNDTAMFVIPNTQVDRIIPRLTIAVTNRLVFAIVDDSFTPPRLLDFVNLKSGTVESNLFDNLYLNANGTVPGLASDAGFNNGFNNLGGGLAPGASAARPFQMPEFWLTNVVPESAAIKIPNGFENQFAASLNPARAEGLWLGALVPGISPSDPRRESAYGLRAFLYGINSISAAEVSDRVTIQIEQERLADAANSVNGRRIQVGFNPVVDIYLTEKRMANDPFVHYTKEDLQPGGIVYIAPAGYWKFYRDVYPAGRPPGFENQQLDVRVNQNQIGFESANGIVVSGRIGTNVVAFPANKIFSAYAPWGLNANLGTGVATDGLRKDMAYKDPMITGPADWSFPTPTNSFASIGQIGRVHRGTPWQTVYFKSPVANIEISDETSHFGDRHHWKTWSGSYGTHPTNDWALADLFSTAMNENAARGTVSVNQTNLAAWSAILSGVPVFRRLSSDVNPVPAIVQPAGPNTSSFLHQIVAGYTNAYGEFRPGIVSGFIHTNPAVSAPYYTLPVPGGTTNSQILTRSLPRFESLGEICSVDTLSVGSPFLQDVQYNEDFPNRPVRDVPDEVIERIPQQILSLLKSDEPRYVVYAWAQTLRPAPGATITAPGPFYGMATNYVVTGEFATKTVLRIEGALTETAPVTRNLRAVVEDHRVITTE